MDGIPTIYMGAKILWHFSVGRQSRIVSSTAGETTCAVYPPYSNEPPNVPWNINIPWKSRIL